MVYGLWFRSVFCRYCIAFQRRCICFLVCLFVCLFVCHAMEAGAARRRTVFVDVGVSSVLTNRFSCNFLLFSEHKIAFLTACISLKFVVRWRHNFGGNQQKFRKFLKISQKKFVLTTSTIYRQAINIIRPERCSHVSVHVHLYKIFRIVL